MCGVELCVEFSSRKSNNSQQLAQHERREEFSILGVEFSRGVRTRLETLFWEARPNRTELVRCEICLIFQLRSLIAINVSEWSVYVFGVSHHISTRITNTL